MKNFICLFILGFCSLAFAQQEGSPFSATTISNSPQCAADQGKPADSIFLALDLSTYTTLQLNLAKKIGEEKNDFVQTGNLLYRRKITFLAQALISGLKSGALPLVTTNDDVAHATTEEWLLRYFSTSGLNTGEKCFQVTEINSHYSNVFIRGIQASTLEHLARTVIDPNYQIFSCQSQNMQKNFDVYPVFNLVVGPAPVLDWNKTGFNYWNAFKIYLSWAWRNISMDRLAHLTDQDERLQLRNIWSEGPYLSLMRTIPVEEQVILLPHGCKSISRPECSSEGLSSAALRGLIEPKSAPAVAREMPNSSLGLQDFIRDRNDELNFTLQKSLHQQADGNKWISSFQKNYQQFSVILTDQLFAAHRLYSSLAAQKTVFSYLNDLQNQFSQKNSPRELHLLCKESLVISDRDGFSFFKADHKLVRSQAPRLNRFLVGGITLQDMLESYQRLQSAVAAECASFNLYYAKNHSTEFRESEHRPWYVTYLKRYQPIELQTRSQSGQDLLRISENGYMNGHCHSPADCARSLIEGYLIINKVLLFQQHILKTEIPDFSLFAEDQEKVACGFYDPWEVSRLNKKKLWADVGSALLFGWSNVPVYLDVSFSPRKLVSFSQLVEEGKIKFGYEFSGNQAKIGVGVNLGSLLGIPCRIQISQTEAISVNNQFVFNGIYAGACNSSSRVEGKMLDGDHLTGKMSREGSPSMCGQCLLSFSQVSTIPASSGFGPIRFFTRLGEAIMRYNAVKDNDYINPRQFPIKHKYLVETFEKNNGRIPDECVAPLSRGYACMGDLCQSRVAAEYEQASGRKVESVFLQSDSEYGGGSNGYDAWIKVEGCSREFRVPVRCSSNAKYFWLGYHRSQIKYCAKDN